MTRVWILPVPPGSEAAGLDLLDARERRVWGRFKFAKDRRLYAAAHALLRAALSSEAGVAPRDWRFQFGPWGRPELDPAHGRSDLQFNLSHTRGMVACAITHAVTVGIDVEPLSTAADGIDIARVAFTPFERDQVAAAPAGGSAEAFLRVWTLKEAYVKARGLGLSLPLQSFSVQIAPPEVLPPPDDPTQWHAECAREDGPFFLAIVLPRTTGSLPITYRRIAPEWLDLGALAPLLGAPE